MKQSIVIKYLTGIVVLLNIPLLSNEWENRMSAHHISWTHPKLELRSSELGGLGLFSTDTINKDESLAVFGGIIMNKGHVLQLPNELRRYILQISDDLWIGSGLATPELADYINHSCSPNAGITGQILLVAMDDIAAGEEITFDYGTVITEWVSMNTMACNCNTANCRKIILSNDWQLPELQERYKGYFSSYIQEKISKVFYNT